MADKKKQLGDFIEVTLPAFGPDVNARVYRDSVPNERQWQELKATARSAGTLRTVMESEPPGGPRAPSGKMPQEDGDFLDLKDPMTGVTVRMPRGDIPERRWKKLREQAAKGETTADFGQQADALEAQGAREVQPVTFPLSATERQLKLAEGQGTRAGAPQVATEPLDASMPAGASLNEVVKPKVTELPAGEPAPSDSGGGTLGSMARKMMGSLAGGALPGGVADAGVSTPGGLQTSDGGIAVPALTTPSPIGVSGGAAPDAGAPAPSTALSSPPSDNSSGPMPDMGFGSPQPLTNPVDLAVAKTLPQASGTPPMSGPSTPPAAPVDPNATGAKFGVKTAATTPGAVGGGLESDLNRAYADRMRAQKELAQQEAAKSAELAQAEVAKAKSLQIAEQARAAKAQSMLDAQNQLVQAQMKVAESLGEALKVDPKRLWNNRTAEQKANAQLAGFLFGLSGSGADYVRGLQQEVQKDIDTQIQQFEANRSAKVAQFNAYGNVFAQYRQMGLDAATSAEAAKASILDVHQSKLKELEFKYQGTSAGARAADAAAALGVERVAGLNKLRDSAAQRASLMEARRLQQLDIEAKLEARKAAAAGGGVAMPAVLKEDVQRIQDVLAGVRAMKQAASGGFFERGAVAAATASPIQVGPLAGLAARQNTYTTQRSELLKSILGALTKEDYNQANAMIPEKISAGVDPTPYFNQLEAFVQDRLNRRLSGDIGSYTSATATDKRGPSAASNYGFNTE